MAPWLTYRSMSLENKLKYLKPSSPFETSQVAEAYYTFYNRVNKPIQISFTLHLGSFLVFIRTCDRDAADPDMSVIDYLPTAQDYDWRFNASLTRQFTIDPSDEQYCSECSYYIFVQSPDDADYTVEVSYMNEVK